MYNKHIEGKFYFWMMMNHHIFLNAYRNIKHKLMDEI